MFSIGLMFTELESTQVQNVKQQEQTPAWSKLFVKAKACLRLQDKKMPQEKCISWKANTFTFFQKNKTNSCGVSYECCPKITLSLKKNL